MPGFDFDDVTPTPDPSPKKVFQFRGADGGFQVIPWTAGQTFQQAIAAELPAAVRTRINAFDATIEIIMNIREV